MSAEQISGKQDSFVPLRLFKGEPAYEYRLSQNFKKNETTDGWEVESTCGGDFIWSKPSSRNAFVYQGNTWFRRKLPTAATPAPSQWVKYSEREPDDTHLPIAMRHPAWPENQPSEIWLAVVPFPEERYAEWIWISITMPAPPPAEPTQEEKDEAAFNRQYELLLDSGKEGEAEALTVAGAFWHAALAYARKEAGK